MSLMYNAKNDVRLTLPQLHQLPLPQSMGRFHHPLPFGEYAEMVADGIEGTGFKVVEQEYAVTKDHQKFFGLMEVEPALEGEYIPADFRFNVGLRGSHDQTIPRGLTLGTRVIVCSNLCFHGDLGVIVTKQTTHIHDRLPQLIRVALDQLPQKLEAQQQKFDAYKDFTFRNPRHGDAALVEIYRRDGLNAAQLGVAIQQWDNPKYEDHAQYGYSAWRLLNSVTEALKPTGDNVNMNLVRGRSITAANFVDELVGLKKAA